ncbi:TlpA family protein disulfide reductase [Fuchsiella alkaliacetigena]|uniref:TlpA family protein disulfide reductase n=1 Tax=Fuchsiella alkaliacetigena TaxID=957042 RepID=UPI00200A03AB|nr:redoxin domain-containing protein [Fuchsiella alkaliacetigena]MCK8824427.1 redoxin domain-containing protein [Fuchsiella alkaliacetigena]
MKKLLIRLFIIAFLIGFGLNFTNVFNNSQATRELEIPPTTLINTQNQEIELTEELTPSSIILLFLPQSPSSQQQLKNLVEVSNTQDQTEVLAIALGDIKEDKLTKIKEKYELNYPLFIDSKARLATNLAIDTIPTLLAINSQGKIVYKKTGITNPNKLEKIITSLN